MMFKSPIRSIALGTVIALAGFTTSGCYSTLHPARAEQPAKAKPAPLVQDATPQKFLESIYASYKGSSIGYDFIGEQGKKVFDESLYALIKRDDSDARGQAGRLDYDPICNCQDYDISDIKISTKVVKDKTFGTASFKNINLSSTVEFELVQMGGKWLIYDISTESTPSLRDYLSSPAPWAKQKTKPAPKPN